MKPLLLLVSSLFVFATQGAVVLGASPAHVPDQAAASKAERVTSRITLTVPQEDTELSVDGKLIPGTGTSRTFETPPFERGSSRRYVFTAKWNPNTYTEITRNKTVSVRAGTPLTVNLTVDDPNDRARVRYVPTPQDIAEEMVKLAGIGPSDIAFEPGCGDARITIAAVKGGAKKGIGIDIDAERVADSRAKVKESGVADRVEIRLGDALDIKDLSTGSVVFLYMGDHFNMLIRPILWRDLKVGARVVSHRFEMGDWKPDKTVTVSSDEGGEYVLHLWTITEEVKRRVK